MLIFTRCGGGNDDRSEEVPRGNDESSTELSTKEVSAKLREISDWYVTDIWNVGLYDIGYYISSGTPATGEELDIELTLKQHNGAVAKLEEYDTFVNELEGKKYDDVKFAWEKLCKGIRESDKIVRSNEIKAKSSLDLKTDKLSQYQAAFQKYISALSKSQQPINSATYNGVSANSTIILVLAEQRVHVLPLFNTLKDA